MFVRRRIVTSLTQDEIEKRIMLGRNYGLGFSKPKIQNGRFSLITSVKKFDHTRAFWSIKIQGRVEEDGNSRVIICCAKPTIGIWFVIAVLLYVIVTWIPEICYEWKTSYRIFLAFVGAIVFTVLNTIGQEQACLDRFGEKMTG